MSKRKSYSLFKDYKKVLLILAGVTIATLTGDNGLLQKATTAKQANEEAAALEKIQVEVAGSYGLDGKIDKEQLIKNLKNVQGLTYKNSAINENTIIDSFPATVKLNGYAFTILENGKVDKVLPIDYQQVEYLESSWKQWIDTAYYSNQETRVIIQFSYTKTNNDQYSNGLIFGSANQPEGRPGFSIAVNLNDNIFYRNSDSSESFNSPFSISPNTKYTIDIYKNDIIINNISYQSTMNLLSSQQNNSSYLFARHNPDGNGSSYPYSKMIRKIYYCQIFNNNTAVRNYIPCYRNSDKKPGLYDIVEDKFYTNLGTGEDFIAGPKV